MVSTEQILAWLTEVSDPEIPVISVVDLGIVREVAWDGEACVVTLTPTYSGCPAMQVITNSVSDKLRAHGVDEVRVVSRLSPAWTTDWMSAAGRQALARYGIAPPSEKAIDISALRRTAPAVACPHCGTARTQLVSQFGSTSCKALYKCLACQEPFDYFKPH